VDSQAAETVGQGAGSHAEVDPVTLQLIANALGAIADEMATTIFRTAHSTVVRDSMDFSASVCNHLGEQVAQAVSVPFHLGSVPSAMATLLDHYGDDLRPGDVFAMNDPFDGGMHTPDIYVFKPVFSEDELIGFATTTAHHADVGGRVPGTASCDNTEIFQEGFRFPWIRLYRDGAPVEDVLKIFRTNVRIPSMMLGDISAQVAACSVAERGLLDLAERYGLAFLRSAMTALIEYTERLVRHELASWPDGSASYADYLDSDGIEIRPVRVHVTVTVHGDEITADFSECDPMVRGALNCTESFVKAAVYQAVRAALEVELPNTEGACRPINVVTRPGTIANVVMPGASSMRGVTGFRMFDAVNGALAQLIPDRIPAAGEGGNTLAIFSGKHLDGKSYIYYELVCGTWGGNPRDDGNDGLSNPSATAANVPIEVAEAMFPVVVERYGLVADSGGAGEHRGGLAIERAWRCLVPEALLIIRSDRQYHAPYGLSGGGPGGTSANVVTRNDGSVENLPPMCTATIYAGDTYAHRTAGGGGWGDPLARDPEAVAGDVIAGKVGIEAARELYRVVVSEAGGVDAEATRRLRESAGA
jgi:N-methylhydantoinase B/oxoprolinase/acetone carboxylase alpha subunit